MNIVYFMVFILLNNNAIYLTFLLESGNVTMFDIYIRRLFGMRTENFRGLTRHVELQGQVDNDLKLMFYYYL